MVMRAGTEADKSLKSTQLETFRGLISSTESVKVGLGKELPRCDIIVSWLFPAPQMISKESFFD